MDAQMDAQTFVQVRMPARHLVFASLTTSRGRTADLLVEPVVRRPQTLAFRTLAMLQGIGPAEMRQLAEALQARYLAASRSIEPETGRLVVDIDHDRLPEPLFGALLAFQATSGPVWMHFASGRLVMRAPALGFAPTSFTARLRQALAMAKVPGTVQVARVAGDDLEPWRRLNAWRAILEPPPSQLA